MDGTLIHELWISLIWICVTGSSQSCIEFGLSSSIGNSVHVSGTLNNPRPCANRRGVLKRSQRIKIQTYFQMNILKSWGYIEIAPISKMLACKTFGLGAMAEPGTIVDVVANLLVYKTEKKS